MKMNILLTNDDGINAVGLNVLFDVLSPEFNVYAIAPEKERSACSNAFSIHGELLVKKLEERKYSVNGYPADCVCVGMYSGMFPEPDLVVSGINHGPNLGYDQFFSGTVAGARTAYIYGKSGIAVSMNSYHKPSEYFHEASEFIREFIHSIMGEVKNSRSLYSINYPDLPKGKIKGVKYTFGSRRFYQDKFDITPLGRDEFIMKLSGTISGEKLDGSDLAELEKGYISVTPMTIECTDFELIERKKKLHETAGSYDRVESKN